MDQADNKLIESKDDTMPEGSEENKKAASKADESLASGPAKDQEPKKRCFPLSSNNLEEPFPTKRRVADFDSADEDTESDSDSCEGDGLSDWAEDEFSEAGDYEDSSDDAVEEGEAPINGTH